MTTIRSSINGKLAGFLDTMRGAVAEGRALKPADFYTRDDFKAYALAVYFMQRDLSRMACAAKRGNKDETEAARSAFYASFRAIMKQHVCLDGTEYVASDTEAEAYLPHVGTFRKQPDGQYLFTATGEASFRKSFERTLILRIDGGEMRTAEEMRAAREAKAAAKKAAAKAAKEAAKQIKPDPKPEEIDVYKDKKEAAKQAEKEKELTAKKAEKKQDEAVQNKEVIEKVVDQLAKNAEVTAA